MVGVGLLIVTVLIVGLQEIRRFQSGQPTDADTGPAAGVPTIRFVKNPQPAPAFRIQSLDGQAISLLDLGGKVVLLNFWATWCPPCREEIPDLIELQNKYDGRLQIIGLSVDTGSSETVERFAEERKINYPVAIASPELEAKFGGVMGLPTSFLVDTEGRVVQKHVGLHDPVLYDREIRVLLNLPVEAKIETFEETGQVLLANAKNATELPGVDLSKLTLAQKKAALRQLNEQKCTCGCNLTLAQCRINDTSCPVSTGLANQVVEKVASNQ
ncbi:MAG: TlpA family protein disulfide reductase [Acidobacteria bacterium]|nr:TlpA family protein disulfide reductase [Acidobacteriota bacterium]